MIPWKLLDRATVPEAGGELSLYQRGEEFSIRITGRGELMNSRVHGSEDALALLTCARLVERQRPRLLIGGLGMGFTLAAALRALGPDAEVVVAELVPAVVAWNRGALGAQAGNPLRDARATVREIDVARVLRAERNAFDAILLDVDNGPEGLTRDANDWLYGNGGLAAAFAALRRRRPARGMVCRRGPRFHRPASPRRFRGRGNTRAGAKIERGPAHHLACAARRGVTLNG